MMSGTSMDGIDLAHVTLTETEGGKWDYQINAAKTIDYSETWRIRLSKLRLQPSLIFHKTDRYYGQYIGQLINEFIEENNLEVDLIASHGHTVFHQPENNITAQVGDGNAIAAVTGIPTVANFRAMDVVKQGQGAPLVGLADELLFNEFAYCLNIGGFANISANVNGERISYDICPANIILNRIAREFGQDYDEDGKIAESGQIDYDLLAQLNEIEFYHQSGPKSLGREWINKNFWYHVRESGASKEDKMKTMVDHIALQIANQIEHLADGDPSVSRVFTTGGGAFNTVLIDHLKTHTEAEVVIPEEKVVEYKEALAFALLGVLRVENKVNINAAATGATSDSIAGGLFGDFSQLINS
jgi:anhydro-N-acetylmuramic acid kinase